MSYCRFSDGDVYLYEDVYGGWTCCACRLQAEAFSSINMKTLQDVEQHLLDHITAGHDVPDYALQDIRQEIADAALPVPDVIQNFFDAYPTITAISWNPHMTCVLLHQALPAVTMLDYDDFTGWLPNHDVSGRRMFSEIKEYCEKNIDKYFVWRK